MSSLYHTTSVKISVNVDFYIDFFSLKIKFIYSIKIGYKAGLFLDNKKIYLLKRS
jgi:hypothetical protein